MDKQINIKEALDWYIWAGVVETCGDFACIEEQKTEHTIKALPEEKKQASNNSLSSQLISPAIKNAKDLCEKISSMDELREVLINSSTDSMTTGTATGQDALAMSESIKYALLVF